MDSLQALLGGSEIITVRNHINVMCPHDPFETSQTIERALWYDVTSIPDVRIDGRYQVLGAMSCPAVFEDYKALVYRRFAETGGLSPIEISGRYNMVEGTTNVWCTLRLIGPVILTDLRSTILVYEDSIYADGGFFYGTMWNRITRQIYDQSIVLSDPGDEETVAISLPIDPGWNLDRLKVIAYVQRTTGDLEVYQAAFLPDELSAVGLPTTAAASGIESAWPNPFCDRVEI